MNSKQDLVKVLTALAEYFRVEITKEIGKTYIVCLQEYDTNWQNVFVHFVKNSNHFPTVNEIIKFINPKKEDYLSRKQLGIELVNEVLENVKRFGWNNYNEANEALSPSARSLVNKLGGWERICKADTTNTAFMAQARDIAETVVTNENFEEEVLKITNTTGEKKLSSPQDIINSLDIKKI